MKFASAVIGTAFLCSLVYAKPPKPTPNFGFGKLVLDGAREAINSIKYVYKGLDCYHDFNEEIIDKCIDTLVVLSVNLMSCTQTNVIEEQDSCTARVIEDMRNDSEETFFDLIQPEEFPKYLSEECKLNLDELETHLTRLAYFSILIDTGYDFQGVETTFAN